MGEPGPRRAAVAPAGAEANARRWSALHHGIDPVSVVLLRPWLAVMWRCAEPIARRRVPPSAVTATGVVLALGAVPIARPAPALGAAVVVLAAVCDGLDGAVAVVGDRASAAGARADAVADRVSDAAFAAVLWRCGAPRWMAGTAGALALGVDVLRRVRGTPARITVGERPSWTVCAVLACASAAATPARWPVRACAAVWIALGAVASAQLLTDVRPGGPSR